MVASPKGSTSKHVIQLLLLVALTLYVIAKDVMVPQITSPGRGLERSAQAQIIERLASLETSVSFIKDSVCRVEGKLDAHVEKGK